MRVKYASARQESVYSRTRRLPPLIDTDDYIRLMRGPVEGGAREQVRARGTRTSRKKGGITRAIDIARASLTGALQSYR